MAARAAPDVVLSYGMGADSTALLDRWIFEPQTRPCDLADLLVVTAQTGNEWPVTGKLATRHVLPLMREHGIRWAQVARAGPRRADGITVLDDTPQPAVVCLDGDYKLSDELTAAGTVPQAGGPRRCSMNAKGWPLDQFIARQTSGVPYIHVVGYEASEVSRALRDARYNTDSRTGSYRLIEWGWNRQACEDYILARLGVRWRKSACTFCPFALSNAESRRRVLGEYQAAPEAGVKGLIMERVAVSLNPRQGLIAGQRLADLLAATPGQEGTIAAFEARLSQMPWNLYEVRRALTPRAGGSAAAFRQLRIHRSGTRTDMATDLAVAATRAGAVVDAGDGIERMWLRHRGQVLPTAEWFWVAAPAGAQEKEGRGFAAAWSAAGESTAFASHRAGD
jgi:hypothetical protein